MKCQRQPDFLKNKPTPINDIWEVHLSPRIWRRLVHLATARGCTYSTISRFCVFRLAEPERLRNTALFRRLMPQIRGDMAVSKSRHRHMICLYGEDVVLLRLAAMRLNMTVSAFIRLALWLYLPRLAMENRSKRFIGPLILFQLGTKRWMSVPYAALNHEHNPALRRFAFASFPPWFWW
ncbi:hypothetical protein Turpa_4131 [Turneriella parva DSM 21527]|uniref:DUF1564 family protein n=2 Tax=Turneriella TaxID=338321 RepID=I4BBV7_TURPD|nr:hypothetical protein Turpa_4131 [Turneriella parva DSM 21527]